MSRAKMPLCPMHRGAWPSWASPRYENTRPCRAGEACAECASIAATHARMDQQIELEYARYKPSASRAEIETAIANARAQRGAIGKGGPL